MWSDALSRPSKRYLSLIFTSLLVTITANASGQESLSTTASDSGVTADQGSRPTGKLQSHERRNQDSTRGKLGAGDLVEVSVYGVPELTSKARVSNTGDLYLPLIDYVHVGDLTLEETQELIEKRLSDGGFVKNPHVTVFVDEFSSQGVTLLGEVARPGVYPALGNRHLFDLISAAGGFTDKAGKLVTITHRNQLEQVAKVRLPQHLESGAKENVEVLPGDTVVVSRAGIVYVVGEVGRPSGFLMENDSITVLQAIAMAGGTNKTAKLNGARIIRKTPQGMQVTPLPLKRILQAKESDLPMQAEDILFVPSSAGRTAMYRSAEAVMQAATALTIVTVHP